MKKYTELSKAIIENVGGIENVKSLIHCQTRLRFNLYNNNLTNVKQIESLQNVISVIEKGGTFQVVIGPEVGDVYKEINSIFNLDSSSQNMDESQSKIKLFDKISDFISAIFKPIVPALAGAGMVKALLAFLTTFKLVDPTTHTYIMVNLIGDATFAFMPVLLAYTVANKLKANPVLAAVTASMLVHPTWANLVADGTNIYFANLIPLRLVKYSGSVIPIILIIIFQSKLEKKLEKLVPASIRLVIVPMLLFLIMGVISFSILGPIGSYVGEIFTSLFTWLSEKYAWLQLMLLGGLYSPLVIFGLHHGLAPLGTMQMAQMGFDSIFGPAVLCANIGQGTAALVVAKMSKDKDTKQIGVSAGVTGLMGITEPALYGINVPKIYPLIAGMIGGAAGSLFAGITKTRRFATGSSGLPAIMMYIGDGTMKFFWNISISIIITIIITTMMTIVFHLYFMKRKKVQ